MAGELDRCGNPGFVERPSGLVEVPGIVFPGSEQPLILPSFSERQKADLAHHGISFTMPVVQKSLGMLKAEFNEEIGFINPAIPLSLIPQATEVAFDPHNPLLLGSGGHGFDNQMEMLDELDKHMRRRIPGVRIGIGHISVYAQIWLAHKKAGIKKDDLVYFARSATETAYPYIADIGRTRLEFPMSAHILDRYFGHPRLVLFPVAVPIDEHTNPKEQIF